MVVKGYKFGKDSIRENFLVNKAFCVASSTSNKGMVSAFSPHFAVTVCPLAVLCPAPDSGYARHATNGTDRPSEGGGSYPHDGRGGNVENKKEL